MKTLSSGLAAFSQVLTSVARVSSERAGDYLTLTKPRIASFVFLSAFVAALLGQGLPASLGVAFEVAVYVTCVAGAGCAFNMLLERDVDRLMTRTRHRPTVDGRLSVSAVVTFGALLAIAGALGLWMRFGAAATALALATLFTYVAIYTPLKRSTPLNTLVGALPGAAPPLIAHVATAGHSGSWGIALFAIVFAWQFPHFMAIAYLYRDDYARAGMKMVPALPNAKGAAGRQAALYAAVLLPVSLLPGVQGQAGLVYTLGSLALGLLYAGCAVAFALREDERRARLLLLSSLIYLPIVHLLVLFDPMVRAALAA